MDATAKQLARHRASCALCAERKFCATQARLLVKMGRKLVAHPPDGMPKEVVMPQAKVMFYLAALYLDYMQCQEQNANLQNVLAAIQKENIELKKKYAPELLPPESKAAEPPQSGEPQKNAAAA